MAGQLKVDSINADSNLSFRIANTAVAFIDSNGLRPTSGNVSLDSTGTTGIRLPAANTLAFHTAGTEDMRIDATGNVGIGTSSPAYSLDVRSTAAPAIRLSRSGSAGQIASMVFEDGTATLGTGNTTRIASDSGAISFSTGGTSGAVTGGTERLRIPADAAGITFPATQAASSNANTLDDYEEGTWTPNLGGNTTYSTQSGQYAKIGRLVTVWFDLTVNSIGTGATNLIYGLPFTGGGTSTGMPGSVAYWDSIVSGLTSIYLRVDISSSTISTASTAGNQTTTTNVPSIFKNGSRLIGSMTYYADA
jgi:hypothetical protein